MRLIDLFEGRRQLIIYHFMFDPDWEDGCPSCTAGIDELNGGFLEHLHTRDTSYALVSRAPLEKLERWRKKRGWDHLRWYSSNESTFNYDFRVSIDESVQPAEYNFRTKEEWQAQGEEGFGSGAVRGARPQLLPAGRRPRTPTAVRGVSSRPAACTTSSTSPPSGGRRREEPKGRTVGPGRPARLRQLSG